MDMPIIAVVLIALVALVIYFDIKKKGSVSEVSATVDVSRVKITDIKMPFGSMVVFMIKWAIASIPAIIILWMLFMMFGGVLTGLTHI